jgi:hypothetical protein
VFQLVRVTLNENHQITARTPLQPLFELREDAMALAEFSAARSNGEYRYECERDCWWASDPNGRMFRFVVEPVAAESNEMAGPDRAPGGRRKSLGFIAGLRLGRRMGAVHRSPRSAPDA